MCPLQGPHDKSLNDDAFVVSSKGHRGLRCSLKDMMRNLVYHKEHGDDSDVSFKGHDDDSDVSLKGQDEDSEVP